MAKWSGERNADKERKRQKRKLRGNYSSASRSRSDRKAAKDGAEIGKRAFIPSYPARETTSGAMLVRRKIDAFVRFEIEDWHRDGNLDEPTETIRVTAIMESGRRFAGARSVTYERGERERLLEAMVTPPPDDPTAEQRAAFLAAVALADQLRKRRWETKRQLLGDMQRMYQKGIPCSSAR